MGTGGDGKGIIFETLRLKQYDAGGEQGRKYLSRKIVLLEMKLPLSPRIDDRGERGLHSIFAHGHEENNSSPP